MLVKPEKFKDFKIMKQSILMKQTISFTFSNPKKTH